MSFIPSFILSALLFFNAGFSGGWSDASFSEGIICCFPYTGITVSLEEKGDGRPALRNAAAVFESEKRSLKLAAGTLAVTGAGSTAFSNSDRLSAALPGKDDARKPLSFFVSWKNFSLLVQKNRVYSKLLYGHTDVPLQNALTAGWTRILQTADDSWFLRYPWHTGGNLVSLSDTLSSRFYFKAGTLEAAGTASFSLPDMMSPAAGGKLNLLFASESEKSDTQASLSVSAAPSFFMKADGTFIPETLAMSASFTHCSRSGPYLSADNASDADQASSRNKASVTFKASAGFTQRQPEEAKQLSKRFYSAELSLAYGSEVFSVAASVSADRFCLEDAFSEGTLSPALDLSLFKLSLNVKGSFKPFSLTDAGYLEPCKWSAKAGFSENGLSASYEADFTASLLEMQSVTVSHKDDENSLKTTLSIKEDSLLWTLSYAHTW